MNTKQSQHVIRLLEAIEKDYNEELRQLDNHYTAALNKYDPYLGGLWRFWKDRLKRVLKGSQHAY